MATNLNQPSVETIGAQTLQGLGFDAARLERVREKVHSDIEQGHCHGVSMIVARHGEVVLRLTDGYADRAANREAVGALDTDVRRIR